MVIRIEDDDGTVHFYKADREEFGKFVRGSRNHFTLLKKQEGILPKSEKKALQFSETIIADFRLW